MADVIAHKLTATNTLDGDVIVQYVAADKAAYATKLLIEDDYEVVAEQLTELPEGVSLDVVETIPDNAAEYLE